MRGVPEDRAPVTCELLMTFWHRSRTGRRIASAPSAGAWAEATHTMRRSPSANWRQRHPPRTCCHRRNGTEKINAPIPGLVGGEDRGIAADGVKTFQQSTEK